MGEFNSLNDNMHSGDRMLTEELRPLEYQEWKSQVLADIRLTVAENLTDREEWLRGLYNSGMSTRAAAEKINQSK